MSEIVTVYATFPTSGEAERIARTAVEERLAVCANILQGCRSIYRWQGAIETAEEVPTLFKTTAERAPELIKRIGALHSYDVPAVVAWPIAQTSREYASWVAANSIADGDGDDRASDHSDGATDRAAADRARPKQR